MRELREETGLTDLILGPCIWLRDVLFGWGGQFWRAHERYFLARVNRFELDLSGQEEKERLEMTAHRWWSIEELEVSPEVFEPRGLAQLLRPILRGELPESPITVGV